jgi:hypothetical protein
MNERKTTRLHKFLSEGAAAAVALASAVVALVFTVFPGLKPFVATKRSATARNLPVERAVTLDQWRWRVAIGDPERDASLVAEDRGTREFNDKCGLGAEAGYLLYVATDARGFKRRQLSVREALYDGRRDRRMHVEGQYDRLARVPIDAPTDRSVQQIWLWDPGATSDVFARVELYAPGEHLIAFADSKPFRVLTEHELAHLPQTCVPTG